MKPKQVELIIAGCGNRGEAYAAYARHYPEKAKIVGVAEPREPYRNALARRFGVPQKNIFTTWEDVAARDKFADAVIIATQDALHREPALAFAARGYDLLLEKPMAPDEQSCREIVRAVKAAGVIFSVGHVLQYTPYTKALKKILDSGAIGDVICLQHKEPVGFKHYTHSYVRGNWRNERESSPMLLAKSCHDIDWMRYIMGRKCTAVSSFGSLVYFRKENQPAGAADRCLECGVEETCPYSAKKIYLDRIRAGRTGWPISVITPDETVEGVTRALETGPYGRCVYACDNDVVDNQVVNLEFEGGRTASFLMTAFSKGARSTVIHGTRGQLTGDSSKIVHFDYLTETFTTIDTKSPDDSILGGHGGGDGGLMEAFVEAVATRDPSRLTSGPDETLETHLATFAAERARREDTVVRL